MGTKGKEPVLRGTCFEAEAGMCVCVFRIEYTFAKYWSKETWGQ